MNVTTPLAAVYAFGIIMWEIFTSASPYQGMAHPQIMVRRGGAGGGGEGRGRGRGAGWAGDFAPSLARLTGTSGARMGAFPGGSICGLV
mgnify:CR=1 FL=1